MDSQDKTNYIVPPQLKLLYIIISTYIRAEPTHSPQYIRVHPMATHPPSLRVIYGRPPTVNRIYNKLREMLAKKVMEDPYSTYGCMGVAKNVHSK